MQLDMLWKYMQFDMEADNFENEMRQAPKRQKLIKNRNFLLEQQGNMKKIEDDVAGMADRVEAIADERARIEAIIDEQKKSIEENPPADIGSVQKTIATISKNIDALTRYEHEIQKTRRDSETRDRQQKEIRVRAAKAKAEYDQVKAVYDEELKRDTAKLKELRERAQREAKSVDAALFERYMAIKQFTTPPMAQLNNDQCAGCYMSLPSVTLLKIKTEESVVVCDNCGRILYSK